MRAAVLMKVMVVREMRRKNSEFPTSVTSDKEGLGEALPTWGMDGGLKLACSSISQSV